MAKVTLQVAISTVASNGDFSGRVVKGWETFTVNIKGTPTTKKRLWTFWLDTPSNISKGDVVEFQGDLGTKVGDYTSKDGVPGKTVEHSLNNCLYNIISKGEPTQAEPIATPNVDLPF
jgi:hypothetical protein